MLSLAQAQTDTLFDELDARLTGLVSAYQHAALPKATLEPKRLEALHSDQAQLKKTCASLRNDLQRLDTSNEHQTTQLHLNFEVLQLRLDHFEQALVISAQLCALEQRLQAEIAEVKEASVALSKQILPNYLPKFEAGLENFMNRCDQVADELDSLENLHHDITPLMPLYEQWLFLVEQFGEILDERTEALKPQ